jgi:hypothetical protein
MSEEKEVGVFCTSFIVSGIALEQGLFTEELFLEPAIHELLHEAKGCIDGEGLYIFTLSVSKIK